MTESLVDTDALIEGEACGDELVESEKDSVLNEEAEAQLEVDALGSTVALRGAECDHSSDRVIAPDALSISVIVDDSVALIDCVAPLLPLSSALGDAGSIVPLAAADSDTDPLAAAVTDGEGNDDDESLTVGIADAESVACAEALEEPEESRDMVDVCVSRGDWEPDGLDDVDGVAALESENRELPDTEPLCE